MTTVSDLDNRGQRAAGAPFWLRVVWFALVGWWLGGLVISLAYLCLVTIIGFPLAFWLFDRVPFALTLKPRSAWSADPVGGSVVQGSNQRPLVLRAVYFVLVGWWLGALWIFAAYALFVVIIGIPVGLMMLNVLPTVVTLQRN